jgi:hypothetical protein
MSLRTRQCGPNGKCRVQATAIQGNGRARMTQPIAPRRGRRRPTLVMLLAGSLGIALAGTAVALVSGIVSRPRGADDPLFHDPMADVQVLAATRIDRSVFRQKPVTSTSKGIAEPSVLQAFQTPGPRSADIAVRDDLVRQAKAAGWEFESESPDADGRMLARKTIAGQAARLSAYFSSTEQNVVVLRLIYRTT